MRDNVLRTAVAAGALALSATTASAGHQQVHCTAQSVQFQQFTGRAHQAVVEGVIVGGVNETVGIKCEVRVNGVTAGQTGWASGTTTAVAAADVLYYAGVGDSVELCATYVTGHGAGVTCDELSPPPGCAIAPWVAGESCIFSAPAGAAIFSGVANDTGLASILVEVTDVNGVVVASCSNAAPLVASCWGLIPAPPGRPLGCAVFGSGGPSVICGDPPALPWQS